MCVCVRVHVRVCVTDNCSSTFSFDTLLSGYLAFFAGQYNAVFAFRQCGQKLICCGHFHVSKINELWYLKLFFQFTPW